MELKEPEASIFLKTSDGFVRLFLDDILYAEAFDHTTMLQTSSKCIEAKTSIGALEPLLGRSFFRCHRSYLVEINQVLEISKTGVTMSNGKIIPLSRRRYRSMEKALSIVGFKEQVTADN